MRKRNALLAALVVLMMTAPTAASAAPRISIVICGVTAYVPTTSDHVYGKFRGKVACTLDGSPYNVEHINFTITPHYSSQDSYTGSFTLGGQTYNCGPCKTLDRTFVTDLWAGCYYYWTEVHGYWKNLGITHNFDYRSGSANLCGP